MKQKVICVGGVKIAERERERERQKAKK